MEDKQLTECLLANFNSNLKSRISPDGNASASLPILVSFDDEDEERFELVVAAPLAGNRYF